MDLNINKRKYNLDTTGKFICTFWIIMYLM